MPLQLRRGAFGWLLLAALLLAFGVAEGSKAATPPQGTIGPAAGSSVSWQGQYYEFGATPPDFCQDGATDPIDLNCDHFRLDIAAEALCSPATPCNVAVSITWPSPNCASNPGNLTGLCNPDPLDPQPAEMDDFDLFIFTCPVVVTVLVDNDGDPLTPPEPRDRCSGGEQVASSEGFPPGTGESVTFAADAQRYEVRVVPFSVTFSDYAGTATFQGGGGRQSCTQNCAPPLDPPVWISDARVVEGDSGTPQAVFTLTMGWATLAPASVVYTMTDMTASTGSDYVPSAGEAVFAPGTTVTKITVPVQPDLADEPNERFRVDLSLGTAAVVKIYDGEGIATIVDDDWRRYVSANATTLNDGRLTAWVRQGREGKLRYNEGSALRFYSTYLTVATFDDLTHTAHVEGRGYRNGRYVTFSFDATDRGAGALDTFVLTLSDGTRVDGALKAGDIQYLG